MTSTAPPATTPPAAPSGGPRPPRWSAAAAPLASGLAVLLAGSATGAVVGGGAWFAHAAVAVAMVVLVGALLVAVRAWLAAPGQLVALTLLATARFTGSAVGGVLPGPEAVRELWALLGGAGDDAFQRAAQQRLAAGEAHLAHAEQLHRDADQP